MPQELAGPLNKPIWYIGNFVTQLDEKLFLLGGNIYYSPNLTARSKSDIHSLDKDIVDNGPYYPRNAKDHNEGDGSFESQWGTARIDLALQEPQTIH